MPDRLIDNRLTAGRPRLRRAAVSLRRAIEHSRLVRLWRFWRTRNPVTFTEKVRYKMLRDHRPLVVTFADKAAVRDYVTAAIGEQYLPKAYAILHDPADLMDIELPESFAMKPTHGSGAALIVSPEAQADAEVPPPEGCWVYRHVRPAAADRAALVALGQAWLTKLYGQGPNREWVYGQIPRQVIVEELLAGPLGSIPDDYKLFVFHGHCRFIQVDSGRFGRRTQDFFDRDWRHLDLSGGPSWASPTPARPSRLDEMISLAERLGAETDFVRVDLYLVGDRIVFGELTSFPAGGHSPFEPDTWDTEFGGVWRTPAMYGVDGSFRDARGQRRVIDRYST